MTPKSCITLCVIGILYVIMAAIAILSPHGVYAQTPFANAGNDVNGSSSATNGQQPDDDNVATLTFKNDGGIEVQLPIEGIGAFNTAPITVEVNGAVTTFTAADFSQVLLWAALPVTNDSIIAKDNNNNPVIYRSVDLTKSGNAYLIYADGEGNPLDKDTFGTYCLYVVEGKNAGILLDVKLIDIG